MPRPLVLLHGYSATGDAFHSLRDMLVKVKPDITDINIGNYVSLNNEITIKDIAEGLHRAFKAHPKLKNDDQEFDAIVHSTGMLVLRSWLVNYPSSAPANLRLKRLKHLIGLAPATWGSPQAHKGRTWLGALVKGNRDLGPDFLNAGDMVLDGLELGSKFTWDLAHLDLLGPKPFYDSGSDTPYVAVFIGNTPYDGLASFANDPGTDGTVRWSGCGLNTRKIILDLTRHPAQTPRAVISKWASTRLDVPILPVEGRNHGSLLANPDPGMMKMLIDFLDVNDAAGYGTWLDNARQKTDPAKQKMLSNPGASAGDVVGEAKKFFSGVLGHQLGSQLEGWQQFVVHARDERGDGISDYVLEVLKRNPAVADANDPNAYKLFDELFTDVHAYRADPSYRSFHIRLPIGASENRIPLRVRLHASTGTRLIAYQGYGEQEQTLTAESLPVELDLGDLGSNNGSLFCPFTTTLIEIIINREPLPFHDASPIFGWIS